MLILLFLTGLCWGSFLNVLIYRLPREKDWIKQRSFCPHCHKKISWFENLPVLSFLLLRGRCSGCQGKISWRYPLVEVATGLFFIWSFPSILSHSPFYWIVQLSTFSVFLIFLFVDIEFQILPNALNAYLGLVFLAYGLFHYPLQYWLLGGVIGFGFPWLVTWLFYKLRGKVGLGGGDIKLFGVLGLYLGPIGVLQTLLWSCFLGSLIGSLLILTKKMERDQPFAFGPFIILVASLQIFLPQAFNYFLRLIF